MVLFMKFCKNLVWIVILLFCFSPEVINASELDTKSEIKFGIAGGVVMSQLWGIQASSDSWKPGVWLGGFCLMPIAENFLFRPEINFNMRGYRHLYENESDPNGAENKAILDLHYIDFPMLFQFSIEVNETLTPDVVFGPYLGLNTAAYSKNKIGDSAVTEELESIRKFDLGVIAGGRLHYAGNFYLNLRGGAGIIPIINKKNPPKKYNLWIIAGVQYCF